MGKVFRRIFLISAVVAGIGLAALFVFIVHYHRTTFDYFAPPLQKHLFTVQSIDTMKYSRDVSGQVLDDPASFKPMIDAQMKLIADTGATHAAIATPYDAHFLPVLKLWVNSAREHGLSVWFRGNFSGWEGCFRYDQIDAATHEQLLKDFIRNNPGLFENGDIFTPCPECENGGPGDPRQTGDTAAYNAFLQQEEKIAATEFARQGKYVGVYPSMNADIARQIISPATVSAFGGTILIDHYVSSSAQFASDLKAISGQLKANVGLGEFGAPIPDLNGDMTGAQQATYINSLFDAMYRQRATIPIVNYWTLEGGSTAIVADDGAPELAYTTVQNYFKAFNVYGAVYNSIGEDVGKTTVTIDGTDYGTETNGTYQIFVPRQYKSLTIHVDGYATTTIAMPESATTTLVRQDVYLEPLAPDWWYGFRAYLYKKF